MRVSARGRMGLEVSRLARNNNRFLSAVRGDQRLRPSPHTPAQKEHEAVAVLGWQGFAESCHAQDLILVRKGGRRDRTCRRRDVFTRDFFLMLARWSWDGPRCR